MTEKTAYAPGEPIWVDLGTPDMAKTAAFYGALFGWTADEGNPEFGGYATFFLDGKRVAGVMPLMAPGMPPVWSCYLCSDDADKTTALVTEAGGTVMSPPMAVGDLGTMAIYVDPAGAVFGIWQPGQHTGAELVGVDGAPVWFELNSRDLAGALPFYGDVFGLVSLTAPENAAYTELQLGGSTVAGAMTISEMVPAEVPSYWMPYFGATDPKAKAEQVAGLGGTILVPFMEYPGGTFSIVQDPHGSTFGLLHMNPA